MCKRAMPQTSNPDPGSVPRRGAVVGRCLACLALLLALAGAAAAEKGKPLSVRDAMELLQGGVPSSRIAQLVAEQGISFRLFDELEKRFREAGATQELIDAIQKASLPQEPEPQPSRPGTLKIQSQPGEAEVYLNDEPKGMTSSAGELRLSGLAAGTYRLRVSLAGYKSWENTIKVTAGETATAFVTLEQKAALPAVMLGADRPAIEAGQSVTLTWAVENATDVDIEPDIGKVEARGATSVSPRESTTYTLTAMGAGGVNKATTHVAVSTPVAPPPQVVAPVPGGIPNFPIPGARLLQVKFYESAAGGTQLPQRIYQTQFNHRSSRYINWELDLSCPPLTSRVDFTIDEIWYNPNGTVFARQRVTTYADAGWDKPVINDGRGWQRPGMWKRGLHRVELYVNGNRVASATFQIL